MPDHDGIAVLVALALAIGTFVLYAIGRREARP